MNPFFLSSSNAVAAFSFLLALASSLPLHAADPVSINDPRATIRTPSGELQIFPADNPWNQDVSQLPVDSKSAAYLKSIGLETGLHPAFGAEYEGNPNGIPYVFVSGDQAKVAVEFEYADESDAGPYPIPADAPIEGGPNAPADSDRHVLMIDHQNKMLYELFHVTPLPGGGWKAGSGAIFDLTSNRLRTAGMTSADAAGLPIFPGLVRYDDVVKNGAIHHALRFTVRKTQRGYIAPATHWASNSKDRNLPPMGLRVRLRPDFDIAKFPPQSKVVLQCLKTYGMLLADNGSDWFITGEPHPKWDDDDLHALKRVKGSDLQCVDTGELVTQ
jgi:hypothetical protein